jgi:hypothetical protein
MTDNVIPGDVAQLIVDKIDSVAQLEALLLLRGDPSREWNAAALAKRLYISEEQTRAELARLYMEGFLTVSGEASPLYAYQPTSTELQRTIDRLADIYSKHLVPVTNLIHSKPKTRVQEFADAFKLRKDK